MNAPRQSWLIRIEPLPCAVPPINRVRSALKLLLRRFGLRCTAIIEAPPPQDRLRAMRDGEGKDR